MKRYFKTGILLIIIILILSNIESITTFGYTSKKTNFSNIVICLDPGHQKKGDLGTEPISPGSKIKKTKVTYGTTGVYTRTPEYIFNLKLSLKIEKLLEKDGFKVVMTRTTNNVDLSNIDRAKIANKAKANLFVRIHADGSSNRNIHGISVLYPAQNAVSRNISDTSKLAASTVLNLVIKGTSAKSNGIVKRNDMTGFNWCKCPSILIESGFMSNVEEDKELENDVYENELAQGIANGIEAYFIKTNF